MSSKKNGEEDEDSLFLENILDKLYDFGNGPASKKNLTKAQKKKKRKREEEGDDKEESPAVQDVCSDSEEKITETFRAKKQQKQIKAEQKDTTSRRVSQVEVVTFQDPRKKLKTKRTPAVDKEPTAETTEEKEGDPLEVLNLEKARLEVHRFGITGYKKETQREFEKDRAVMLGARPPKKEYVNYKVLQQQIKERKQKKREEVQPDLKKKKKPSNPRDKQKKVSGSGSGSAPSGQVGRFKNGMLVLSTKEIQKIKQSNKRRR